MTKFRPLRREDRPRLPKACTLRRGRWMPGIDNHNVCVHLLRPSAGARRPWEGRKQLQTKQEEFVIY
eukprot:6443920-Prorocentrum_lima.AAC.1